MQSHRIWIENLRQYSGMRELKQSDFFSRYGPDILCFLKTPQTCHSPGVKPRVGSFTRITQWNIEKGKQFDSIVKSLENDEVLRWSDILILNEADLGIDRKSVV